MKSDCIIKTCFSNRYEKISIQDENYAIDEYYIIDNTYILTFYDISDCLSEINIIINNLYSDIITIQNQNLDDKFYKYEIYLILICSKKEKINICDINKINKNKFTCRKLFVFGNEDEVIHEINGIFNLSSLFDKRRDDVKEEEKIFFNDVNFLCDEDSIDSFDKLSEYVYKLKTESMNINEYINENILNIKGILNENKEYDN